MSLATSLPAAPSRFNTLPFAIGLFCLLWSYAFIAGKIRFGAIARLVEATLDDWVKGGNQAPLTSADDAISVDHVARNRAAALLPQIALKAS